MTKLRAAFYAVILCLTLSACAAVASPTATSASAATSTIGPTAILATITSTPGPTKNPSPTSLSPLVWAEPFDKHVELKAFTGEWSPTANEMAGIESTSRPIDFQENTDTLILASAPAFVATVLDDAHKNTTIGSLIWSLDGQKVFYGIYRSREVVRSFGTLWSIARDGTDAVEITDWSGGAVGWMDARTLVYTGYNGGGESHVGALDVLKNLSVTGDFVTASIEKLHPRYIPVVGCRGFCNVCVLPKTVGASQAPNDSRVYVCQSEPGYPTDLRPFPRPKTYPDTIDTIFQDWQVGTNNMLILAQGEMSNKPVSRLLLWNVDTDRVTSPALGGLFGRFSPDGKLLAYITSGPFDQYTEKNAQNVLVDITIPDEKQYLQIMNVSTRQIMLHVSVKTSIREDYSLSSSQKFTKPNGLSFSPDGRYLAFVTDGFVTLKNAHFPTDVIFSDTDRVYLNVLDLQEEKLILSMPGRASILWAPTSDKFICTNFNGNWQLFELSSNTLSSITQINGDQLIYPAWSYDGSYLSFSSDFYASAAAGITKTYILDTSSPP